MNKRQLIYFLTACRTKNIQAAADELYITHQGLSRVLSSLESELGQALFDRSNRGIEPTDFALTLIPLANRLIEDYNRIEGIRTLSAQNKSVVTVYALDHILSYLGTDFVEAFYEKYPGITLSVVDTTDETARTVLEKGFCDCALINGPVDYTRFEAEALFYSPFCLRMRKDHPLAKKQPLCISDFNGEKLIGKGRAYECFRHSVEKFLLAENVEIDIPLETSDEHILQELVERKGWIAATYEFSALDHCGSNTVLRYMDGEEFGQTIYFACRRDSKLSKAAESFRDFIIKYAKRMRVLPEK